MAPREAGLPVGFDRIELLAPPTTSPPRTGWAFGAVGQGDERGRVTLTLTDDSGLVLARVHGIRLRRPVDVQSPPEPALADAR
jgi:hypothetical protein